MIFGFATVDRDEWEKDQVRDMEELGDFQDALFRLVGVVRVTDPADNGPGEGRLQDFSKGSEAVSVVFDE